MAFRSLDEFMAYIARPGAVWMTSGERGGGKTHTAVATIEMMVKGRFPHVPKTIVATNIIFYHMVDGEIKVEPPPGVEHIRTMRDFFPIVVKSIKKYGRDVLIMLLLDEAQGFIGGDLNSVNASIPMKEFMGTIRKYNTMVWYLTPSAKQLGPAFRNLINGSPSGNVTCRWQKDLSLNERWIKANHLRCSPKQLMIVRPYDADPVFIQIPVTEWTGTVDKLREGQYCYDHEASATFREGEGFSFNDFNDFMGGVASIYAMDEIERFYDTRIGSTDAQAAPVRPEAEVEREVKARTYSRMQQCGMNQRDAARVIGVPRSTLNEWCADLGLPLGQTAKPAAAKPRRTSGKSAVSDAETDENSRPKKGDPDLGRTDGGAGQNPPYIYVKGDPPEGGSKPFSSVQGGDGGDGGESRSDDARSVSDPAGGSAVPDGRYTLPELRRAVEYCTRGEDE